MNPRSLAIGLLTAICVSSVSAFIMLTTLQNTILDREVTKGWLKEADTYESLTATVTQSSVATANKGFVSDTAVQAAVQKTFTPEYAQTTTEDALDNFYDWAEGDTSKLDLSLPLSQKQPELTANLASEISQQISSLPTCGNPNDFNAQNPTCLPQGLDVGQTANQLAAQTVGNSEPLQTDQSNAEASTLESPSSLPGLLDTVRLWVKLAPIIAITSAVLIFAIATVRLRALTRLSIRLLIGVGLTLLVGLLLAYFGQAVSLDYISGEQQAVVRTVLEPVLQTAVPDIGRQLAIVSGSVAAIVATGLVVLFFIRQRFYGSPVPVADHPNSQKSPKI